MRFRAKGENTNILCYYCKILKRIQNYFRAFRAEISKINLSSASDLTNGSSKYVADFSLI